MRNAFYENVLENIKAKISNESYDVQLFTREKENGIMKTGVVFLETTKNTKCSPIIYLDDLYEKYEREGCSIDVITETILDLYNQAKQHSFINPDIYMTKEFILENVFIQVINTKMNVNFLESIPHREILNVSAIYRCQIINNGQGVATYVITNDMLKMTELTEEELYIAALENTNKLHPITCISMYNIVNEMDPNIDESVKNNPMYVITNEERNWGANALFYPSYIVELAEKLDDDLIIFPSSIHELIVLPAKYMSVNEANIMLNSINPTLETEDILSDRVYFYNKNEINLIVT